MPNKKSISQLNNTFICHNTASTVFELHANYKPHEIKTFSAKCKMNTLAL